MASLGFVLTLKLALLVFPTQVHVAPAYIDPGTGSMVLQLLVGATLGLLMGVRRIRMQLGAWVGRLFRGKSRVDATSPAEAAPPDPLPGQLPVDD